MEGTLEGQLTLTPAEEAASCGWILPPFSALQESGKAQAFANIGYSFHFIARNYNVSALLGLIIEFTEMQSKQVCDFL